MRILVVDDEIKLAEYLRKGLTEEGFIVDVAHNGVDGLHLASAGQYDLIVLDRMLPGGDGLGVLAALLGNATRYAERGSTVPRSPAWCWYGAIGGGQSRPTHRGKPSAALFVRFYRADPRSRSGSNHGLGLSIVAAIARLHGGRPFVESEDCQTAIGLILPTDGDR